MIISKDVKTVLQRARERITRRKHWCQGVLAIDKEGSHTSYAALDAVAWCAAGAIYKETGDGSLARECEETLERILPGFDGNERIGDYNDAMSHAEVLALFDRAIGEQS